MSKWMRGRVWFRQMSGLGAERGSWITSYAPLTKQVPHTHRTQERGESHVIAVPRRSYVGRAGHRQAPRLAAFDRRGVQPAQSTDALPPSLRGPTCTPIPAGWGWPRAGPSSARSSHPSISSRQAGGAQQPGHIRVPSALSGSRTRAEREVERGVKIPKRNRGLAGQRRAYLHLQDGRAAGEEAAALGLQADGWGPVTYLEGLGSRRLRGERAKILLRRKNSLYGLSADASLETLG